MERVLITQDGKRVVVNKKTDPCLYESPYNPPNTGTAYTRGIDLYAHKARSGKIYFYFSHWSLWQGEEDSLELISKSEAEEFLLQKAGLTGHGSLDENDYKHLKEYGFNLLDENA